MAITREVIAGLSIGAVLMTSGCASTAGGTSIPDDIVLVLGAHANSPAISAEDLAQPLSRFDAVGDRLTIVVAQGTIASAVYDRTLDRLPGNSLDREDYLQSVRVEVSRAIAEAAATTPEVDLVEAIAFGAAGFSPSASWELWVVDPGLQTTGALSMLDGALYAEPADLVGHAEQAGALPDLSGTKVVMQLAVNVEPQQPLGQDARAQLEAIWSEFFTRAGATDVTIERQNLTATGVTAGLPTVTPVDIRRPDALPRGEGCTQRLESASIGFAAGSASLTDPDRTRGLIERAAAGLTGCEGAWLVEGSASSEGDSDANRSLSTARAETVAALVSEVTGLPREGIEVIGWGEEWPCRRPDVDKSGQLVIEAASYNRSVTISKVVDADASRC